MRLKYLLSVIIPIFTICLSVSSQPCLSLHRENLYLGEIAWKQPASVEYTVTNTGDQPLIVTDIIPSCGCVVAHWTKSPIYPGSKGTITITYDAKLLGRFHKSASIYSNASPKAIHLHFTGVTVQKPKNDVNAYPYVFEQIQTDKNEISFPLVYRKQHPAITVNLINLSDQPYTPEFMHLPSFLKITKTPHILQKGEKGTIELTLETDQLNEEGLIQTSTYLSRFQNDEISKENEIPISIILLPHISQKDGQMKDMPAITLSETNLIFNIKSINVDETSQNITIANTGKAPLQIRKLQVTHPGIEVNLKRTMIQPDKSTNMKITIQKNRLIRSNDNRIQILIITNDPDQPIATVNVQTLLY
ncbi:hypothetical protein EZS27_016420 [termite gut metagenome]|uniref:HYDIN/VesB/CFA65-like Ig-like domain-containing protein n=1 Tax=termite gut metagenome TaxID=433724 RepID=A0A5J4RQG3_9ZZZZ